jgi:RHS repeat-associated protein
VKKNYKPSKLVEQVLLHHSEHLCNVRAVLSRRSASDPDQTPRLLADYYPFGWRMPGRLYQDGTGYRYGYQGQETDAETGWSAFQLRMYDGRMARWMSTDPKSQYFSPYLAMGNTPMKSIDPTGGSADDYFQNAKGDVIWRPSTAGSVSHNGETYKNIGSTFVQFNGQQLIVNGQEWRNGVLQQLSKSFTAYSGQPDYWGFFNYDTKSQAQVNSGPIPAGNYRLYPNRTTENGGFKSRDEYPAAHPGASTFGWLWPYTSAASWGEGSLRIFTSNGGRSVTLPDPTDPKKTITRSLFTIHGGDRKGSNGCIDVGHELIAFLSYVRTSSRNSPSVSLQVRYPNASVINWWGIW